MRYPVIVVPFLRVDAVAIYPFILVQQARMKHDAVLIRHETIHLLQEIELLIAPFYLLYLINYLVNLWRYRDHDKAYLNIVFEREAYACERDQAYLTRRRLWNWRHYIKP